MIITELRRSVLIVLCSFVFGGSAFAQVLEPAPELRLLNAGYGAAALGMGGAFTAVATDLSATYWNPAGAALQNGMQFYVDYSLGRDSDEDFAAEVQPNRFDDVQRFALTGNQFRSFAFAYTFQTKSYRFTPMVAWQRTDYAFPDRQLKETAGAVNFLTPQVFFQSEGTFQEETKSAEHEWAVGMSAMVSQNVLIGGTLNFLTGDPEIRLSGVFHDSFVNQAGTTRTDLTIDQKTTESLSGTYFKIGMLFFPRGPIRIGGTLRFPYTRSSTLKIARAGTAVTDGQSTPVALAASASTEVDVPMEWSAGAAIIRSGAIVAGSVTYSDWSTTQRVVTGSTDPLLIPELSLPYPLLRFGGIQNSLLQYRVGTEYIPGRQGSGIVMRAGYMWDGQPYGNGDRSYLKGYSFGAGYITSTFRIDGAYVRESGDARLTPFSAADAHLAERRIELNITFMGQ